jgi:hypothetical protein
LIWSIATVAYPELARIINIDPDCLIETVDWLRRNGSYNYLSLSAGMSRESGIGGCTTGTVQEAGSFSVILKDVQGKTIVIPTKNILDKEIVIESGPPPATQKKKL